VLFLTTANVDDNIPYPLLDRMELIQLSGYTLEEKREIAKRFLLPKLLKEHALDEKQITLADTLLVRLIDEYTKEAGVRQLERLLAKLLRKSIQILLSNKKCKHVDITSELVEKWLGAPRFRKPDFTKEESIGLATGLAWTEVGGDVLEIEVMVLKGKGGLTLTGQLGEVMQESGQAAMSYTRSRAKDLGLKEDFYSDLDVHIHVPEGAIPKDGPSAGITMVTAVVSALTKVPVRNDVAMTGEVSLQGRVIGIGGLKEKLLAAIRFEKTTVIVPKENEKDVLEFRDELDKNLKIIFVKNMDEVLRVAFVRTPFKPAPIKIAKSKKAKTSKKSSKK
jgi:ATP-dependent Lon protease